MSPPSTTDEPRGQREAGAGPPSGGSDGGAPSVLSSLPSTRPQRPSARRAAARRTAAGRGARGAETDAKSRAAAASSAKPAANGQAKPAATAAKAGPKPAKPRRRSAATAGSGQAKRTPPVTTAATARAKRTPPRPAEPPVPPQGFEAEEQIELGRSVQPPNGSELAVSLAELVGELAQTSLATGGRLLSDALKRLAGG